MSSVVISGNTSGTITLDAPAVAGTTVLTLPATTGNIVTDSATQTLTNKTLTSPTITGALVSSMASSVITSGTAVASTSGTSIDFTSIPSWVKRITVMLSGVSTNGTSVPIIQIGDSGGIENTAYSSWGSQISGAAAGAAAYTTGFGIGATSAAASSKSGAITLHLLGSNILVASGVITDSGNNVSQNTSGSKTLSGTLDRVRITTVNGTDTFDAGSINILFE
jgi:hypothetical protein